MWRTWTIPASVVGGIVLLWTLVASAQSSTPGLLTDPTDCTINARGGLYQPCVDLDDGKMWVCKTPSAGGEPGACDSPGEWLAASGGGTGGSGGGGAGALDTSTSNTTIANSTTGEATLYQFVIPGGTLGNNQCIEQNVLGTIEATGGSGTLTIRGKYGTGETALAVSPSVASNQPFLVSLVVCGDATTSAQEMRLTVEMGPGGSPPEWRQASIAVDSTAGQLLTITGQWSTATSDRSVTKNYGHVLTTGIAIPSVVVTTFNGRQGTVTPANGDYAASQITTTPAGNLAAITQAATNAELDTEKAALTTLSTPGTINNAGNPVDWTELKNVPAGFADGTDDGGGGGGATPTMQQVYDASLASPVINMGSDGMDYRGATSTSNSLRVCGTTCANGWAVYYNAGWKVAVDGATQAMVWADAGNGGNLSTNDGTINQSTDPVDWTRLKNVPAGFADGSDDGGGGAGITAGDKGPITVTADVNIWTQDADSIANSMLANMANGTIKCRNTAGTGDPEDCTSAQVAALMTTVPKTNQANTFTSGQQKNTGAISEATAAEFSNGTEGWLLWGDSSGPHFKSKVPHDSVNDVPSTFKWDLQLNSISQLQMSAAGLVAQSPLAIDFGSAASTALCKRGTTAPATCTVGQCFFDTDATAGSNTFGCTATDTWTLQGGTSAGVALTANPLSQFAATTSAQLLGVLNNETGGGLAVFDTNPTFSSYIELADIAAPATPSAGRSRIYKKTGSVLCEKNSAGTETCISGGAGAAYATYVWNGVATNSVATEYPVVSNRSVTAAGNLTNAHRDNIYIAPFDAVGGTIQCSSGGGNVAASQTVDYTLTTASAFGGTPTLTNTNLTCQMAAGTSECHATSTFAAAMTTGTPFMMKWVKSVASAIGGATWYMTCQVILHT